MSLDWDATKVAVRGETKEERTAWNEAHDFSEEHDNWTLLETLIWRSINLGYGWELTEKNLEQAIKRNDIIERVWRGVKIPPAFFEAMIGLRTNVGPETDASFFKILRNNLEREANAAYRRHQIAKEKGQGQ